MTANDKAFQAELDKLTGKYHAWQIWSDWVYMFACALSQPTDYRQEREDRYLKIAKQYEPKELDVLLSMTRITIDSLEENPEQDFLGNMYMILGLGDHWKGQFFTPYHLCSLMADIDCDNAAEVIKKSGYITINDCACGGGATLIGAFNKMKKVLKDSGQNVQDYALFVAQDISEMTALMAYIQLSLLGCAAIVKVADSLLYPMTENLLNCRHESNIWLSPMYNFPVWKGRQMAHTLDLYIKAVMP